MTTGAIERHDAMVRAYDAGRAGSRLPGADDRWSASATRFRLDPRRERDPLLEALASYLEPSDVLLDVGGGAGRLGLPLAGLCKEVVNVEPSRGMGEAFLASAAEAGIVNARLIAADWLSAPPVAGDVVLVANVTYFVPRIAPFVEKLAASTRRRVIIVAAWPPPPNQGATLYRVVHGREQAPTPGPRELVPALWEMGILPDVRVLPGSGRASAILRFRQTSRQEVIDSAVSADVLPDEAAREAARRRVEAAFDELFELADGAYRLQLKPEPRTLLITWETARRD